MKKLIRILALTLTVLLLATALISCSLTPNKDPDKAKEALKKSLQDYRGTILLICHEPEFYRDVVHEVWDCSQWTTKIV